MKSITENIKDEKTKGYFSDITKGDTPKDTISAEDYEKGIEEIMEGLDKVIEDANEVVARHLMGDIPEAISFSYIAKTYFGKSRAWLMQKVNGNTVNGKTAAFSDDERAKFRAALLDISDKLTAAAHKF